MIALNDFSVALKKIIRPAVEMQIYARAPGWQLVGGWNAEEKVATRSNVDVMRFDNNSFYIPIMTSYHSGVVAIAESETLVSGKPQLQTGVQTIATETGDFEISKQLLNVKDAGAIAKSLTFYSQSLADHMAMDLNRQVYGDGSGKIGTTATSGSPSTDLVLTASTNGDIDYARYLPVGTKLQIGSSTTTQTVTAVVGTNEVTITPGDTWSPGDAVYKVTGSNTHASEIQGLGALIATSGTYAGLSTATEPTWKAALVDTTSTTLSVGDMDKAYMAANRTGNVDWIIMNASLFRAYGEKVQPQLRFAPTDVLYGGWKGLEYMGGNSKILLDYDCPDDSVLFLTSKSIVFGEFQKLEFEKGTDGYLLREVTKLNYEVVASWMGNLATTKRSAFAKLTNRTPAASPI